MIEVVCNDRLGKKIRVKAKYCPFPPPCDLCALVDGVPLRVSLIFPNEDRPWSCNRKGGSMEPELQLLAFTQWLIYLSSIRIPISACTCCIHLLLV